jgi:hypothetical protein
VKEIGDFRLLCLRNPWGKFEWGGDWSDHSSLWDEYPEVKDFCKPILEDGDGQFWMAYEDFLRLFSSMDICQREKTSSAKMEQLKKGSAIAFDDEQDVAEVGELLDGADMSKRRKAAIDRAKAVFGSKKVKTEIWNRLDANGNGFASCAEIDKMVVELSETDLYNGFFQTMNHKPAIMRAYQWTIKNEAGSDGDAWVEKKEFNSLLKNLYFFNELWEMFEAIDTGHDRRVDFDEFQEGMSKYGLCLNTLQAEEMFSAMDTDGGGQILFSEFCEHFMLMMDAHEQAKNPKSTPNSPTAHAAR